jgi:hypothetical protein
MGKVEGEGWGDRLGGAGDWDEFWQGEGGLGVGLDEEFFVAAELFLEAEVLFVSLGFYLGEELFVGFGQEWVTLAYLLESFIIDKWTLPI